ncbi:hypothetical protein [Sandaracinus amylolyticus]|nr:hypothetical protein [Sandaracinus amylolyticus]
MNGLLEWALTNAALAPSAPRWRAIWERAPELSPTELAELDRALAHWPDGSRVAHAASLEDGPQPAHALVRRLELEQGVVDAALVRAVLGSEHTARVSSLALFSMETQLDAIRVLADAAPAALRELQLAGDAIADDASEILAASALPIRVLTFEGATTNRSVRAIAAGTGLPALDHLQYHDVQVDDEGVVALAASERMARLGTLRISYAQVGRAGAEALASTRPSRLEHLDLGLNHVGHEGARALVASSALTSLRSLHLSENRLGGPGVRALAEHCSLERLAELSLSYNQDSNRLLDPDSMVGTDGVRALAAARWLRTVERLELAGNAIGDEGMDALCTSPNLGGLRELDVADNQLGSRGVAALLASSVIDQLKKLRIELNELGDDARDALFDACEARGIALVA